MQLQAKSVVANVLLMAMAAACFTLGAFLQHQDIRKSIDELIASNPYAFYIRNELYAALRLSWTEWEQRTAPSRMQEIMKYGFPGLDDVRLYSDFILSYDRRNRVAHWVCEHLRAPCMPGSPLAANVSRRSVSFQADMNVPSTFRASAADYERSGFDRGHLAAAGNHKCHQSHCNETFYMTNIAPQVGRGFNRDAWNNLEIYVRELTEHYGSVYVWTGPLYLPKRQSNGRLCVEYELIGSNTVAVPTHFFKVLTIESRVPGGAPYMEAYVMPNAPIADNTDLRSFLCDIREIESAAGLQFFKELPRSSFFATNYSTRAELLANFI